MLKKLWIPLAVLYAVAWAESGAIDREIAEIMAAPPKKRVEMMNAFKRRLFQMNQRERALAIRRLRESVAPRGSMPAGAMPPARSYRREHVEAGGPRSSGQGAVDGKPAKQHANGGAAHSVGRGPSAGGGTGRGGRHR